MTRARKLIVFDFGNVLIDLHYQRHFEAFRALFGKQWPAPEYPFLISETIKKYETGQISDEAFIWQFQQLSDAPPPREIVNAWLVLLGDIHAERLEMLQYLKAHYQVAMLSNINALHLHHIRRYLQQEHDVSDFEERFFDKVFYSHELGLRKPEEEIYMYLEEAMGFNGKDILFIDDRWDNVETAQRRSWHAIRHKPGTEITENINAYLRQAEF